LFKQPVSVLLCLVFYGDNRLAESFIVFEDTKVNTIKYNSKYRRNIKKTVNQKHNNQPSINHTNRHYQSTP
jgi:hypothetical protein